MKKIPFLLVLIILVSCNKSAPSAQEIVDKAIEFSGTEKLREANASFTFRDIGYEYYSSNGDFSYTRIQKDSMNAEIKDVLTNQGLTRYINNEIVDITNEKRAAYSSSVNSVIYFAFLPLWLNDAAVNKTYVGTIDMKRNTYHKIKVTFESEGGGEDFEDVFYYWFDTKDYSMDYLAYSYNEEDGKGMRFREAYNIRRVNGVIIQDYKNLKPQDEESASLSNIDQAFVDGELIQLSLINLEDVLISTK